jgi:hypothetical protein
VYTGGTAAEGKVDAGGARSGSAVAGGTLGGSVGDVDGCAAAEGRKTASDRLAHASTAPTR